MTANRSGPQEPPEAVPQWIMGVGWVPLGDYDALRTYADACEALLAKFVLAHDDEPANYAQVEKLCAEIRTFLTARAEPK